MMFRTLYFFIIFLALNMRMPVYLVCAALVVAVRSDPENNGNYLSRLLEPVNVAADQETVSYLLPKLAAKYRPNSDWSGVNDPRFYVLTEMESNDVENQDEKPIKKIRNKRYPGGTLSVAAPIQTLRDLMYKNKVLQNRRFIDKMASSSF